LKSSKWLQAAFQMSSVQIRERFNQWEVGDALFCLQKSFVNLKAFGVKRIRIDKFSIILKKSFKK
jgi:hypothetical protein